jgi:hypothetical protein
MMPVDMGDGAQDIRDAHGGHEMLVTRLYPCSDDLTINKRWLSFLCHNQPPNVQQLSVRPLRMSEWRQEETMDAATKIYYDINFSHQNALAG